MGKWFVVVTLLLVAIIAAFGVFVATGVIDGPSLFWNLGMKIGWVQPHLQTYAHGQDAEAWINTQEGELQRKLGDLQRREAELAAGQGHLEQRAQQLDKREAELNAQAAKLQEEQAQRRNVQTLAEIYTEMSAEEAARILEKLDQTLILEVLLQMDMQYAANILIQLPNNLAVALSELLGQTSQ